MPQKTLKLLVISMMSIGSLDAAYAGNLTLGDANTDAGAVTLSGFLRAKYQDKSWSDQDHKLSFDTAKINLDYKSPKIFGHVEYRCYQFSKLCDFSSLVDGYVGYNLNATDNVTVGLQNVPFGPGRFWESNWYGGIMTQIGLEDVHNLGINYHFSPFDLTHVDLAYFAKDGGKYGSSDEASRYSANVADQLEEKNMWNARVSHDFKFAGIDQLTTQIGGSYWYSDIKNNLTHQTGDRKAWNLFSKISYDNLAFTLTGGQNKVNNGDSVNPDVSTVVSFKDRYAVANQGDFYTADLSYSFKDVDKIGTITPYAMYSTYQKDAANFKNSTRNLIGVSIDHKNLTFVTEYVMSKNDFLIGGDNLSYSAGDNNKTNRLLNLQMIYNF